MKRKQIWKQLILFISILLLVVIIREYILHWLVKKEIVSYKIHTMVGGFANLILIFISYYFIKKDNLEKTAGLKSVKLKKWYLLLFPLIYLSLLNAIFLDDINTDVLMPNIIFLLLYTISVGVSEELSIRGFIQSYLIDNSDNTKKSVIKSVLFASLFFGGIHLINFDKGIYGELSQVFFASFIGIMFGALLVITKKLVPLMIIHSIIDFIAKLDSAGIPIREKISNPMSLENALFSVLLTVPCLVYGMFLMRKYKLVED